MIFELGISWSNVIAMTISVLFVHCSVFLKALEAGRESVSDIALCFINYVSYSCSYFKCPVMRL